MKRCDWVSGEIHTKYHDTEWGTPLHNDRKLFEFLILDAMQSGLSWRIILNKRTSFQKAFDNFDAKKIAKYSTKDVKRLLADAGIIRNKRKIDSVINNAERFLETKTDTLILASRGVKESISANANDKNSDFIFSGIGYGCLFGCV